MLINERLLPAAEGGPFLPAGSLAEIPGMVEWQKHPTGPEPFRQGNGPIVAQWDVILVQEPQAVLGPGGSSPEGIA